MDDHEVAFGLDDDELPLVPVARRAAGKLWPHPPVSAVVEAVVGVVRDLRARMDAHVAASGLPDEYEQVDVYIGRSGAQVSRERGEAPEGHR